MYGSNVEKSINEVINLTTKVKRKSDSEWYFWVDIDLYVVKIGKRDSNHYELSFIHKDIETKEETSNLTHKHTPFHVIDGIIVVMKEFIEENKPKSIEFSIYGDKKKAVMFKSIMEYVSKKHKDIFGAYKVKESETSLPMEYDFPEKLRNTLKGVKFTMEKI